MALSCLARLLFGLALLAQVAASVSAPMSSGGARICAITHSDARAQTFFDGTSEQAPQRETGHRHGPCSFCLFGSGDPPLHARMLDLPSPLPTASERIAFAYSEGLIFFQADRNASARAPPAFS
jgi:hypothetical protein